MYYSALECLVLVVQCSVVVCGIGCRYWSEEAEAASICRAGPQTTFNQLKTNFSHFLCNSYIFRTFSAKFTFSTLSHFILDNLQAIDSSTFSSKCISSPLINVLHFWAEKARTNSRDAFWKWTTKNCIDRNIIQTNEKYSVSMVRNTISKRMINTSVSVVLPIKTGGGGKVRVSTPRPRHLINQCTQNQWGGNVFENIRKRKQSITGNKK